MNERSLVILLMSALVIFSITDMIDDLGEGASWRHLTIEGGVVLAGVACIAVLVRRSILLRREMKSHSSRLLAAHAETTHWKEEASDLLRGLGSKIDEQFERWELTAAEKEVGLLLLKGLSLKEVADIRSVSERTVRTQSLAIYAKGSIAGRAELSAFFLEDLLLPLDNPLRYSTSEHSTRL